MQLYFSFARSFSEIACTRAYRWLLGTIAVCACVCLRGCQVYGLLVAVFRLVVGCPRHARTRDLAACLRP